MSLLLLFPSDDLENDLPGPPPAPSSGVSFGRSGIADPGGTSRVSRAQGGVGIVPLGGGRVRVPR